MAQMLYRVAMLLCIGLWMLAFTVADSDNSLACTEELLQRRTPLRSRLSSNRTASEARPFSDLAAFESYEICYQPSIEESVMRPRSRKVQYRPEDTSTAFIAASVTFLQPIVANMDLHRQLHRLFEQALSVRDRLTILLSALAARNFVGISAECPLRCRSSISQKRTWLRSWS
jgi:hypothetical protein